MGDSRLEFSACIAHSGVEVTTLFSMWKGCNSESANAALAGHMKKVQICYTMEEVAVLIHSPQALSIVCVHNCDAWAV